MVDANSIPSRGKIKYYGQFILTTFRFEQGLWTVILFLSYYDLLAFFLSFSPQSPMVILLNCSFIAIGHALSEYVCMLIRHSEAKIPGKIVVCDWTQSPSPSKYLRGIRIAEVPEIDFNSV